MDYTPRLDSLGTLLDNCYSIFTARMERAVKELANVETRKFWYYMEPLFHEENVGTSNFITDGNYYCLLPTKANSKWFYYPMEPLHSTDVQPGETGADNIVFVRTYKPYMYKTDNKLNIAFVLKTALADRLGRRNFPAIYSNLDGMLEKVVPVFNVAEDSNYLEFNEKKVSRRYELEPLMPLHLEEHYLKSVLEDLVSNNWLGFDAHDSTYSLTQRSIKFYEKAFDQTQEQLFDVSPKRLSCSKPHVSRKEMVANLQKSTVSHKKRRSDIQQQP